MNKNTTSSYGNPGNRNPGNRNTGNGNTGSRKTGNGNTGSRKTGNGNTGSRKTGNGNTGNRKTGNGNTGNRKTGNGNTGSRKTGNGNTGNRNTGNNSKQTSKKNQEIKPGNISNPFKKLKLTHNKSGNKPLETIIVYLILDFMNMFTSRININGNQRKINNKMKEFNLWFEKYDKYIENKDTISDSFKNLINNIKQNTTNPYICSNKRYGIPELHTWVINGNFKIKGLTQQTIVKIMELSQLLRIPLDPRVSGTRGTVLNHVSEQMKGLVKWFKENEKLISKDTDLITHIFNVRRTYNETCEDTHSHNFSIFVIYILISKGYKNLEYKRTSMMTLKEVEDGTPKPTPTNGHFWERRTMRSLMSLHHDQYITFLRNVAFAILMIKKEQNNKFPNTRKEFYKLLQNKFIQGKELKNIFNAYIGNEVRKGFLQNNKINKTRNVWKAMENEFEVKNGFGNHNPDFNLNNEKRNKMKQYANVLKNTLKSINVSTLTENQILQQIKEVKSNKKIVELWGILRPENSNSNSNSNNSRI